MKKKTPTDFQRNMHSAARYVFWLTKSMNEARELYDSADYLTLLEKLKECQSDAECIERHYRNSACSLNSELTPEVKLQLKRAEAEALLAQAQEQLDACEEGETE